MKKLQIPFLKKESGKGKKKKKPVKAIIAGGLVVIVVGGVLFQRSQTAKEAAAEAEAVNTAKAELRDITSELSSTGTLEAKDTYSITAMAEGEVISADFEEGDQVEKGQVLYEIDKSSVESELTSATNSLTRAQEDHRRL